MYKFVQTKCKLFKFYNINDILSIIYENSLGLICQLTEMLSVL